VNHSDWEVQKEIRFLISAFFTGDQSEFDARSAVRKARSARDYYLNGIPPAFESFDIPLNEEVLRDEIAVTLGGNCHTGHYEMVRLLMNEHTNVGEKGLSRSSFRIQ
jgi:hypothetical protein